MGAAKYLYSDRGLLSLHCPPVKTRQDKVFNLVDMLDIWATLSKSISKTTYITKLSRITVKITYIDWNISEVSELCNTVSKIGLIS